MANFWQRWCHISICAALLLVPRVWSDCVVTQPCTPCTTKDFDDHENDCEATGFYQMLSCSSPNANQNQNEFNNINNFEGINLNLLNQDEGININFKTTHNRNHNSTASSASLRGDFKDYNTANRVVLRQSCRPDFSLLESQNEANAELNKVLRFELLMVGVAFYSVYYVQRRKKAAYQRLTNLVNT